MTRDQEIIRAKVGLVELAKQLGNASQACKIMRQPALAVLAWPLDAAFASDSRGRRVASRSSRIAASARVSSSSTHRVPMRRRAPWPVGSAL